MLFEGVLRPQKILKKFFYLRMVWILISKRQFPWKFEVIWTISSGVAALKLPKRLKNHMNWMLWHFAWLQYFLLELQWNNSILKNVLWRYLHGLNCTWKQKKNCQKSKFFWFLFVHRINSMTLVPSYLPLLLEVNISDNF